MGLFSRNKKKNDEDKKADVKPVEKEVATDLVAQEAPERKVDVPQTDDVRSYTVLRGPHVTEKAAMLGAKGTYVFKIDKTANKIQVKDAVQKIYKVSVTGVRVISVPGKTRRIGKHVGTKPGYKKALVTLKKGDKIDVAV